MMDVMTPAHPRWREFCGRLNAAIGGSPEGCNGDRFGRGAAAHENARAILAMMGADIARSIEFFEQHGVGCDCEVLGNVDREQTAETMNALDWLTKAEFAAIGGCLMASDPAALAALIRAKYPEDAESQRVTLDALRLISLDLDAVLAIIEAAFPLLRGS